MVILKFIDLEVKMKLKTKYAILLFIMVNSLYSKSLLIDKSHYDIEYNDYQYEDFGSKNIIFWNKDKKLESEWYKGTARATHISIKDGRLYFIRNECFVKNEKANEIEEYQCGKTLVFDKSEKVIQEYCATFRIIDPDLFHIKNLKCGTEIHYQPDGTKKIIEHETKCKDPCELHFVKRHQGLYTVFVDALRVREKPSDKAKTIFTIYKDQEVELLEDTQIFFKVDFYVAPWVKIKTKDGRTGYVYGAFLKTKELYVEAGE